MRAMDLDMSLDELVGKGYVDSPHQLSGRASQQSEPYGRSGPKRQGGRSSSLADSVREAQRNSFMFVKAWRDFCDSNGTGDYDPSRYDEDFLRRALQELRAQSAPSNGYGKAGSVRRGSARAEGGGEWKGGGDWKGRWVDDGGESWRGQQSSAVLLKKGASQAGSGSAAHARLVESIKQWQRSNRQHSVAWSGYCDEEGDGSYDPSKYSVSFLEKALQELGVERRGGEGGGGGGAEAGLSESVREWQRASLVHNLAWRQYCDQRGGNGNYDPSWYDAAFLRKAVTTLEIDGAPPASGGAGHSSLVEKVKAWQRESIDNTTAWRQYCDDMGDGHYDPSRHEASFLQAALEQLMGRTPRGSRKQSLGGGGGWGGGQQDGGAAGSGRLTERVKEVQRTSIQGSKAWREYCIAEGDGSLDPAHYDANFLRTWLAQMDAETW